MLADLINKLGVEQYENPEKLVVACFSPFTAALPHEAMLIRFMVQAATVQ